MKKGIALLLTMVMTFSLAACGGNSAGENKDDPAKGGLAGFTAVEDETAGKILLDDFAARMEENDSQTALELAQGLMSNENIQFMGDAMAVEPGFLPGFKADITGFKEAATFAPMISTIPFVGYVFVLEEGQDVKSFATTLKENADPAWNICTEAEQTVIDYYGNTVFFVMCPKSFEG